MKLRYLKKEVSRNTMKHFAVFTLLLFSILFVSASVDDIGTKKTDDCIDLIQTCADCTYTNFTSYTMPNGTRTVVNWAATKSGTTFTYNNCNITSAVGRWYVDGVGDIGGIDTIFTYYYDVTNTGNPTPEGMPMFQMGVLIIIFGTACFLLFISMQLGEVGPKIFFLVLSFIFLSATMLSAYMISMDGNVSLATNTTTLSLVTVLGMVLVIIFLYILIRQTVNALDLYRIKKGTVWQVNPGANMVGYNSKKPY